MSITHKMPLFFRDNPIDFPNIIAYYSFNDNANNLAQDNYHGTLIDNPIHISGKYGKCYEFSPLEGSHISTTLHSDLITNNLTYAFWVYPKIITGAIFSVASDSGTGVPAILCWRLNDTTIRWNLAADTRISTPLSTNTWTHLALTYDGTTWKTYKNGIFDGQYVGNWAGRSGNLFIGKGFPSSMDGSIDEFVVTSNAYSEELISSLMTVSNPL